MTKSIEKLLKLEELGQFLLSIILFNHLGYSWWVYPALLLLPDLSMVGYLVNTRTGAWLYNLFHHKLVAILILALGYMFNVSALTLAGIIFFGHSAMDRIFGYGLKLPDNFKHTHLGWIGTKG
ncbi:DUF4260 domain-containing protein [Cyclobacterium salsum]|uniref:DUF4260 domain-containing protein n=1 Tax=Cyclobacterium salsum TaxID=2666329 RepID=UPI001391637B|nr:DUF4260 domain-containing protein [Cyclobacterium salsum]